MECDATYIWNKQKKNRKNKNKFRRLTDSFFIRRYQCSHFIAHYCTNQTNDFIHQKFTYYWYQSCNDFSTRKTKSLLIVYNFVEIIYCWTSEWHVNLYWFRIMPSGPHDLIKFIKILERLNDDQYIMLEKMKMLNDCVYRTNPNERKKKILRILRTWNCLN